jgi:hypothetical protein
MPEHEPHPSFSFHIEDGTPEAHNVPAAVLVQILENAQRAFELIGVQVEGGEIKSRARIAPATSKRFQLVCQLPEAGSYVMPVKVGGTGELFSAELAHQAYEIFQGAMKSVSARNGANLAQLLPSERIRRRVLEAVKGMSPRADAPWKLDLRDGREVTFATFDAQTIPFVEATLVPAEQREAARVVIGELKSIDFAERKVTIIYPPTSKELACTYEEAVEDLLYEQRRDLIQVTGRVVLDEQGAPKQIIDVTDIRDLDLSPLEIHTVHYAGLTLKANTALILEPSLDETKQLLCVERADLCIDVFAPTREALLAELFEQIAMLWHEYAQGGDETLDAAARQLKQSLLAAFAEVGDAA